LERIEEGLGERLISKKIIEEFKFDEGEDT
jgi:hypothetical protein